MSVTSRTIMSVSFTSWISGGTTRRPFLFRFRCNNRCSHYSYLISSNKQNTIMFGLFSNSETKKAELISLGLPEEAA